MLVFALFNSQECLKNHSVCRLVREFVEYFMNCVINGWIFRNFKNILELFSRDYIITTFLEIELSFHEELKSSLYLHTICLLILLNLIVLETEIHIWQLLIIPIVQVSHPHILIDHLKLRSNCIFFILIQFLKIKLPSGLIHQLSVGKFIHLNQIYKS